MGTTPNVGLMAKKAEEYGSYYYLYGQNLSLSYFDHPGMIGYILRIFTDGDSIPAKVSAVIFLTSNSNKIPVFLNFECFTCIN